MTTFTMLMNHWYNFPALAYTLTRKLNYIHRKAFMKKFKLTAAVLLLVLSAFAQTGNKGPAELEIEKLSNDWMRAAINRDITTLNSIVAVEFKLSGTDFSTPALPREIWMKNTMENLKIDSVKYINMRLEVIDNVAIVQSRFYWSFSFQNMPAKQQTVNLVDTWINRGQAWQVVSRIVVN
jgi:hypothetical protein